MIHQQHDGLDSTDGIIYRTQLFPHRLKPPEIQAFFFQTAAYFHFEIRTRDGREEKDKGFKERIDLLKNSDWQKR